MSTSDVTTRVVEEEDIEKMKQMYKNSFTEFWRWVVNDKPFG